MSIASSPPLDLLDTLEFCHEESQYIITNCTEFTKVTKKQRKKKGGRPERVFPAGSAFRLVNP